MVFFCQCKDLFIYIGISRKDQHAGPLQDQLLHGIFFVARDHDPALGNAVDQLFFIVAGQDTDHAAQLPVGIVIQNFAAYGLSKVLGRGIPDQLPAHVCISKRQLGDICLGDPPYQFSFVVGDAKRFPAGLLHPAHRLQKRSLRSDGDRRVDIDLIQSYLCSLQEQRLFKMKALQQIF